MGNVTIKARWIWHRTANRLSRHILSTGTILLFTTTTAIYFALLDQKAERWDLIKNHPTFHDLASVGIAGVTMLLVLGRWLLERRQASRRCNSEDLLVNFIGMVGRIVAHKVKRFQTKSASLTAKNKFGQITHPIDQIGLIFSEASAFLQQAFALKEDEIDLTVIARRPEAHREEQWFYLAKHQEWKHADPSNLSTRQLPGAR